MATRSGDIDPGTLPFFASLGMDVSDVDNLLNKQSGLLGLCGYADQRELLARAAQGDKRCQLAFDVRLMPSVYMLMQCSVGSTSQCMQGSHFTATHSALQVFVHRIRKYLGAFLLQQAGHTHAIVFSAGIGENSGQTRAAVCKNLEAWGVVLDTDANRGAHGNAIVSTPGSATKVLVIATDEVASSEPAVNDEC